MNHPWSHLNTKLTTEEWQLLQDWLKDNPKERRKRGDTRKEGRVFFSYNRKHPNGERWITKRAMQTHNADQRRRYRKYKLDPSFMPTKNKEAREKYKDPAVKARIREAERARNRAHPEKLVAKVQKRNARKAAQLHPNFDSKLVNRLYTQAALLAAETGQPHHVDHIIPLISGGWHHQDNMQILPASLNICKGGNAFWTCSGYSDWSMVPSTLWPAKLASTYSGLYWAFQSNLAS